MTNDTNKTQNVEKKDKIIQVGFKMMINQKNVIKNRAAIQSIDMQHIFDKMLTSYFDAEPLTDAEKSLFIDESKN